MAALIAFLLFAFSAFAQSSGEAKPGQVTGVVLDPNQAVVAGAQVTLTNVQTKTALTTVTNGQGVYLFSSVPPGSYSVAAEPKGFKRTAREVKLTAGQTAKSDLSLALAEATETMNVSAGTVENAYRVDTVAAGNPLGTLPIIDAPYSMNVISRQLIDDTQSRNFKEAAKYLPLVQFQEMQGPEVLRPESRGMQGANMQNSRKDGMGFAVTTPSAMEEYDQIEVLTGLGGPLYGPANPSGMFNFVTKRPTDEPLRELELDYEGSTVATVHADISGRFGKNKMFGYRSNLLVGDGTGYVEDSQLRRQLAAIALDARLTDKTTIEGNFSYYNLFQHGYPGWFAYYPSKGWLLPTQAPDPTRRGYGQSFAGADLTSQLGEVRVKHNFSENWQFVAGVLNQDADRMITTPVNDLIDNNGNYKQYFENTFQNTLAPRFKVKSDLGYLTGKFNTGSIRHDVVIGSTGYRFSSYQPVIAASLTGTPLAKTAFCTANTAPKTCQTNIDDPLVYVVPTTGIPSYTKTSASNGIYVASVIHQQGFSIGDTITLTPKWLVRVAASQDWTWTNNYKATGPNPAQNYTSQGVSPTASLMFKPRSNMTIYGTFAQSLQAPDIASGGINNGTVLPPYRSKEGEIGYKLVTRKINFSTALFRIERPFAYLNSADNLFEIVGNQLNYGAEAMLSGRVFESLMVTGGLTVLNPKINDTPLASTDGKTFVGMPDYQSNILAEYRLPVLVGTFFNFDWRHVGRRPVDDANTRYVPEYNTFDLGVRYTTKVMGKLTTWRVTANNITDVHYWSTIGPGNITGSNTSTYLGHLGEPRLVTASVRFEF